MRKTHIAAIALAGAALLAAPAKAPAQTVEEEIAKATMAAPPALRANATVLRLAPDGRRDRPARGLERPDLLGPLGRAEPRVRGAVHERGEPRARQAEPGLGHVRT